MTDFTMHTDQPLSCARVESLASEWVDGALSPELRASIEAHLDGCESCSNLVADLAAIASEARALPRLEPSRDLWAGIEARIAAPVIALEPGRVTAAPPRRWWMQVAAAAALVAVTAGVTWRLTVDRARQDAMAMASGNVPAPAPVAATPATGSAPSLATTTAPDSGPLGGALGGAQPGARVVRNEGRRAPIARDAVRRDTDRDERGPAPLAPLPRAAQAYDHEIQAMRTLVAERRDSLDPVTVRVLERNLRIIDQAIAESRAALAQDPKSGLLAEQLTRAMRRKLELLRTAADLPARIS